jgi:hypothetical protein
VLPRKRRTPKQRRAALVDVSRALWLLLLWGDWRAAHDAAVEDETSTFELYEIGSRHERAWRAIEPQALEVWTDGHPGTRPPSWWKWSAPELRLVTGRFRFMNGHRRCQPTGVPYGEPLDWNDPPLVETTPAYLDRLGLWLQNERARVKPSAFRPQSFSWDLTVAPVRQERSTAC